MNRTYYITLESKGKIYLADLRVEVFIHDVKKCNFTIESIYFNDFDVTNKLKRFTGEIDTLVHDSIVDDNNLVADYWKEFKAETEDRKFREFYEG